MKISKKYRDSFYLFLIGAFLAFIAGYGIEIHNEMQRQKIITGNFEYAIGNFERVGMTGIGSALYIEVSFQVGDELYSASAHSRKYYQMCRNKRKCNGKRFWVVYLKDDPSMALVDISTEIQGTEIPPYPRSFDGFQ